MRKKTFAAERIAEKLRRIAVVFALAAVGLLAWGAAALN
jgi:hypothetical protein